MKQPAIVIKIENLTRDFNGFKALDALSLQVKQGEIYGFLGPNGAGKTTTILALLRIVRPTRGRVLLFGKDLNSVGPQIKQRVGVVSERPCLYNEMTAAEYLSFFADLYQVPNKAQRMDELFEGLDLGAAKHKRLGTFSRGMQQKIGFARAFLHDPELLILDEPISGLDPKGVKQVRDLISDSNRRGKTVFISSHLLSEVEKLCHRVGIINNGRLLAEERMDVLKQRLTRVVDMEIELVKVSKDMAETLTQFPFVKDVAQNENILTVKLDTNQDYRARISEAITKRGGIVIGIKVKEMTLEEAFMTITSQNISLLATAEGGD